MILIFNGQLLLQSQTECSPETKCAAPHPRLTIHKVLASSDTYCRRNYPESKYEIDGRTDGRTDAERHNIIRPFFKWAYKIWSSKYATQFFIVRLPSNDAYNFEDNFCVQFGSYAILGYFGNIW